MENAFTLTIDSSNEPEFPKNHASLFSCPLKTKFNDGWEMALMDITYPKDITFSKSQIIPVYEDMSSQRVKETKKPVKIFLRKLSNLKDMLTYIQQTFNAFLKLTWNETHCTWKVIDSNYFIILSNPLRHAVHLWQDVLTSWDKSPVSCTEVDYMQSLPPDQYLIFVPASYQHEAFDLKAVDEAYSCEKLLRDLDKHIDTDYSKEILRISPGTESDLYIFSEALHQLLPFNQAGTCINPLRRRWDTECEVDLKKKWTLYKYNLTDMATYHSRFGSLSSKLNFQKEANVPTSSSEITTLLSATESIFTDTDLEMTLRYDNHVVIKMKGMNQKIILTEELQNILGLNDNILIGGNTLVSQRPFSAGFHQLYVYCSLVDYSMVGHKEEEILFCAPLNDKTPIHPIYVPVKVGKTKQINFSIRNEKGNLVEFPSKSSTRLRLRFRQ